jgi:hypothetical protein
VDHFWPAGGTLDRVAIQQGPGPALTRRAFLVRAGQGTVAMAILGVWACADVAGDVGDERGSDARAGGFYIG